MIDLTLKYGSHHKPEAGVCAMEAAAWLVGDKHSDHPECVSPVVRRYMVRLNDRLSDEQRQRLRPYILRALGTAGDGRDQERIQMCTEFVLKDSLPFWLEAAGMHTEAQRIRSLTTLDYKVLREVRDAVWAKRGTTWSERRARIKQMVHDELAKKPDADAAAVAVAVADADAVAAAVAAADAVAVADAVAAAVAVAVAVAVAAADAVADAVADAAADAAAVADAVAVAAADADAVADAVADAAAVAAAVADADAVADAVADADDHYDAVYAKAYAAAKTSLARVFEEKFPGRTNAAFDLLDRMLPKSPIMQPLEDRRGVVEEWLAEVAA